MEGMFGAPHWAYPQRSKSSVDNLRRGNLVSSYANPIYFSKWWHLSPSLRLSSASTTWPRDLLPRLKSFLKSSVGHASCLLLLAKPFSTGITQKSPETPWALETDRSCTHVTDLSLTTCMTRAHHLNTPSFKSPFFKADIVTSFSKVAVRL